MALSQLVSKIKPSPTLSITAKTLALKAEGKDIIGLSAGEPDFDTPDFIKQAAIDAINAGQTKYTAVDGTPELKQAVVDKMANFNQLHYVPEEISIGTGGKQCIYNCLLSLLNPGDEVIIPAPYWVSYPDMVRLASGQPVIVDTTIDTRFKMTAEQLSSAITPKTKLVILNTPSNPTGMAYTPSELQALADVLLLHPNIYVATDDIYEHVQWTDTPFANIIQVCPSLQSRSIVLSGVSKAYSMTGWRIGYAAGPKEIIAAMRKIQSQCTSNPCSISQAAATKALNSGWDCVKPMLAAFKKRHDFVVNALNSMPGVTCLKGDGTFYAFANVSEAIQRHQFEDDVALTSHLLTHGVAVVPGSAFGAPNHIRLSFATSDENLTGAMSRIETALS